MKVGRSGAKKRGSPKGTKEATSTATILQRTYREEESRDTSNRRTNLQWRNLETQGTSEGTLVQQLMPLLSNKDR